VQQSERRTEFEDLKKKFTNNGLFEENVCSSEYDRHSAVGVSSN
jgi:hypothetical protein